MSSVLDSNSHATTWECYDLNYTISRAQDAGVVSCGSWDLLFARESRHAVALIRDSMGDVRFIKQRGQSLTLDNNSLDGEIHASYFLSSVFLAPDSNLAPHLFARLDNDNILVFEGFLKCIDVRSAFLERRSDNTFDFIHILLAKFLARMHSTKISAKQYDVRKIINPVPTYGHIPFSKFAPAPDSYKSFLKLLQIDHRMNDCLVSLRKTWEPRSFIHGDLKLDNIIFNRQDSTLHVVDWELSGIGDPYWDIGSIFGSYIYTRLECMHNNDMYNDEDDISKCIMHNMEFLLKEYTHFFLAKKGKFDINRCLAWAGVWIILRTELLLPLRRNLIAIDYAAIHIASNFLLKI